jgi:hypothetical protein
MLWMIALLQRIIIGGIGVYIVAVIARLLISPTLVLMLLLIVVPVLLCVTVALWMLAIKLYGLGRGIALGVVSLIPIVSLIILVVVNGRATETLQQHGIKVGLLDARVRRA